MALFNAVVVDVRKLTEYCLSDSHHRGRHKAWVFRARLGLTRADGELLRDALLQAVQRRPQDLQPHLANQYGQHYILDFEMSTAIGKAMLRSIWIVRQDEAALRFVTCFVR